jgi:hypothetical protein
MNNILTATEYRASPEGVNLMGEKNKQALHPESSPFIHSFGYAYAGDLPACVTSLPIKSRAFMQ